MLNKTWREKLIWSQLWTELKWEFLPWKLYTYMVLLGKQTAYDSPCSGNLLPCYWVKHQPFLKGQVGIFFQTWWNKSFSCCCKTWGSQLIFWHVFEGFQNVYSFAKVVSSLFSQITETNCFTHTVNHRIKNTKLKKENNTQKSDTMPTIVFKTSFLIRLCLMLEKIQSS